MTYPQPSSNAPVVAAQNFFRLNTPLVSPGDIYESAVGAEGFAIGPESDFANIAIDYFDPTQSPTFRNSLRLSTDRAFAGGIVADNTAGYRPSGVPGRILIRPVDLYNPLLPVTSIVDIPFDETYFIPPQLDVIQYFNGPPSIQPARSDKTFYLQRAVQAGSSAAVIVPVYGRRTISYRFDPITAGNPSLFGLYPVNFALGDIDGYAVKDSSGGGPAIVAPVLQADQVNGVIDTKTFGRIDALIVVLGGTNNGKFICRIDVSDQAP